MNSILLQSLIGKTIDQIEIVKEEYEEPWQYDEESEIIIHFTDGTSFLLSAEAQHASDLFMEIKKIDMTAEELIKSRKTNEELKRIERNQAQRIMWREDKERRKKVKDTNELIAQIVAETEEEE